MSSWLPEQSTRLEFKGQLNDGNLELQVDVTPFENENKTHNQKEASGSAITDDSLLQLANNRSLRIKDQLAKLHEIPAKRIISCNPEIDHSAKARPRADFEI